MDEKHIVKAPLQTAEIAAGLRHLLEAGEYDNLAKLLRFPRIDMPNIYLSSLNHLQYHHLCCVFDLFNNGLIREEDAKLILPAKLVSDCTKMIELPPYELLKLPVNPVSSKTFQLITLNQFSLIAALYRGLKERDRTMIWTLWPRITPAQYTEVWLQSEFWRIILIKSFCDAQFITKSKILSVLRLAITKITVPSRAAMYELLMINVSLVAFYLDHLRAKAKQIYRESDHNNDILKDLDAEFHALFYLIESNLVTKRSPDVLFKGLNLESTDLMYSEPKILSSNPFFYEERIELLAQIIGILKLIPNVFADWFSNLFFAFSDIVAKLSLNILSGTWTLFLSFNPSYEGICSLISWLKGRIDEDFRVELAKLIPEPLLLPFYRECEQQFIPDPLNLIPFKIRQMEYLKRSRQGTEECYIYDLSEFWKPSQLPIVLILKVFQELESTEAISLDLFESIDTFFILERGRNPISMRKFIEMVLKLFLKVKEWYIPLKADRIIPSPLFPSQFAPFLAQFIVRCRHLMCKSPFKISEKYLILSINVSKNGFLTENFDNFVQSQMKYLMRSDGTQIPKLSSSYNLYFDNITRTKKHQFQSLYIDFFTTHYALYQTINNLWTCPFVEMQPSQLEEIERKVHSALSNGLQSFGLKFHQLLGPSVFSEKELDTFLYLEG